MPTLNTDRLTLRNFKSSDASSVYHYASNPKIGPIAGWPVHQRESESRFYIENYFTSPISGVAIKMVTNNQSALKQSKVSATNARFIICTTLSLMKKLLNTLRFCIIQIRTEKHVMKLIIACFFITKLNRLRRLRQRFGR